MRAYLHFRNSLSLRIHGLHPHLPLLTPNSMEPMQLQTLMSSLVSQSAEVSFMLRAEYLSAQGHLPPTHQFILAP